ncbi:MAG TPA: methionine--tRNA ligase, partial [Candidatus Gracilibacteria bacterium]|nr:methionine--tRNA ligase [Candidatus Gracilibacteria bacterium]
IAYVNAKPHIGFAMELIQADALARYHRLKGDETFFLTGTDEHGMKLAQTAKDKGQTPRELVDENSAHFSNLTGTLNISNDGFVRTTDEAHKRGAQKLWKKMVEAGDMYKDSYEGLYCVGCEAFVLEKDLVEGKCPNHNTEPQLLKEENFFFRLSKYSEIIGDKIESGELKVVPESRRNEILAVIKEGLRDVSFSRPKSVLKWGIDVPDEPDQVMYVWCDALSNYITAIGYEQESDQFQRFWPADVHLIGKDILRFHSAIWIGMLLSAGVPIPKSIYVHGFITSEGKKMSKSLNNVVDPVEYVDTFGADALRYFLLKEIPTTDDGDFSKERFNVVYESELANNIGNLVSRVLAMTAKYFEEKVPPSDRKNELVSGQLHDIWKAYDEAFSRFDLKVALEKAAELAMFANKYVEETKPWVLAKSDTVMLGNVLYDLLEMVRHLGLMLAPFVPATSEKICGYLGIESKPEDMEKARQYGLLKSGGTITKAEPLFARIVV